MNDEYYQGEVTWELHRNGCFDLCCSTYSYMTCKSEQKKMVKLANANYLVREEKMRHNSEELQMVPTALGDWEITYQVKSQY